MRRYGKRSREFNAGVQVLKEPRQLTAVEDAKEIASAMSLWVRAFEALGSKISNGSKPVFWLEDLGVWIKSSGGIGAKGRYWNALGGELTKNTLAKGIVQVNPPVAGGSTRQNQGVVARGDDGRVWILHRGRINVDNTRGLLEDFTIDAAALGVETVNVSFASGKESACFVVAPLGKPQEIVEASKKFVDLCAVARTRANDGDDAADIQRRALSFEEPSGDYIIPARGAITAQRLHHDVCEALKSDLTSKGIEHSNAKIGRLGPDLYSTGVPVPSLFEIKTSTAADDLLKAVGQLFVYEKLLSVDCRRVLVLPEGLRDKNQKLIESLEIEVVTYRTNGTEITINWPELFFVE